MFTLYNYLGVLCFVEYMEHKACLTSAPVVNLCRICNENYYSQLMELQRLTYLANKKRMVILCR